MMQQNKLKISQNKPVLYGKPALWNIPRVSRLTGETHGEKAKYELFHVIHNSN